jgi:predicted lysophospholipase L1 biosynthesis ABC-type transport system permease subunit
MTAKHAPHAAGSSADHQEACKTFLDQTKQLITLASAFLFAPAAFVTLEKDLAGIKQAGVWPWFLVVEACFVISVVLGYVTIGTIAGTQNDGTYNVFRTATRLFSLAQFCSYIAGVAVFGILVTRLVA